MAVLVVDDDATVVNLVTAVLHRAGIDAEVALDGPGALQRLGRGRYRAVLSDLTMPGMSGLQLLREARTRGHELPFLIMTAYLPPETELALRTEPGVAGVLRKPFDIKRLVTEVRSLLQSAGADVPDITEVVEVTEVVETAEVVEIAEVAEVYSPVAAPAVVAIADTDAEEDEVADDVALQVALRVTEEVAAEVAEDVAEGAAVGAVELDVAGSTHVSTATVASDPLAVGALLPLSLLEFVTARLRRQALIAQAERRAAALLPHPMPRARATDLSRDAEPLREAEQGC